MYRSFPAAPRPACQIIAAFPAFVYLPPASVQAGNPVALVGKHVRMVRGNAVYFFTPGPQQLDGILFVARFIHGRRQHGGQGGVAVAEIPEQAGGWQAGFTANE